jgi:hypothetical protein
MTSAQHAEGRQFNPGWVYFCCGQLAGFRQRFRDAEKFADTIW